MSWRDMSDIKSSPHKDKRVGLAKRDGDVV